jgi:hypothetical protein
MRIWTRPRLCLSPGLNPSLNRPNVMPHRVKNSLTTPGDGGIMPSFLRFFTNKTPFDLYGLSLTLNGG